MADVVNIFPLTIDIKKPTSHVVTPVIVQYDTARLEVTVLDDGKPFDLSNVSDIEFAHKRPDGNTVTKSGVVENGKVVYNYIGSEMAFLGNVRTSFSMINGDEKVSVREFYVVVSKNLFEDVFTPAEPGFNALQELIVQVENAKNGIDTVISETQAQSDYAKAQGDYAKAQGNEALAQGQYAKAQGDYVEIKRPDIERFTNQQTSIEAQIQTNNALTNQAIQEARNVSKGSPSGVYATVQALTLAFPSGNENIYVVTANGSWYYWNGTVWAAGGVYQSNGVADQSVTPLKLSNEAAGHNILLYSGNNLGVGSNPIPNVDTTALTLTFPTSRLADGGFFINGKLYRFIEPNTNKVVPLNKTITSSLGRILFRLSTLQFLIVNYNENFSSADYVTIGTIRYGADNTINSIDFSFQYSINGALYGGGAISEQEGPVSFIPPATGNLPDINTSNGTLTFFPDTILIYQSSYSILPQTVIDLNTVTSSAKKVFYNTTTSTFTVVPFTTANNTLGPKSVLVASIRLSGNVTASMNVPYTVDGALFGKISNIIPNTLDANVKSINHRGYNTIAPENTLEAYRLSKKMGYSYVETDIAFTSDNIPVLLHDNLINRTARNADGSVINGDVNIKDITLSQALTYDFGSWKSANYSGVKIPTFREFLLLCKRLNFHPYMDLKVLDEAQANTLIGITRNLGMLDKVSWISANLLSLKLIQDLYSKARLGYVTGALDNTAIDLLDSTLTAVDRNVFLDIQYQNINRSLAEYGISKGFEIEVWNAGNADHVKNAVDLGVVGITNDYLNIAEILQSY